MNLSPQNLAFISQVAAEVRAMLGEDFDAETFETTIDGETDALDMLDALLREDAEARAYAEAVKAEEARLAERRKRLERRSDTIRAGLGRILDAIGERKIARPLGTVSRTKPRARVEIEDADALPQGFHETVRKPLSAEIRKALEAGEDVPGASLAYGHQGVSVRR